MSKEQYYTIQLYEKDDEFINEVCCIKLEAHKSLQSLDVVAHDTDSYRRHLCYVMFIENNAFLAFDGKITGKNSPGATCYNIIFSV